MRLNNYKTACKIEESVWRSSRLNADGDELVVARGTYSDKPGYFMAWEAKDERPETHHGSVRADEGEDQEGTKRTQSR